MAHQAQVLKTPSYWCNKKVTGPFLWFAFLCASNRYCVVMLVATMEYLHLLNKRVASTWPQRGAGGGGANTPWTNIDQARTALRASTTCRNILSVKVNVDGLLYVICDVRVDTKFSLRQRLCDRLVTYSELPLCCKRCVMLMLLRKCLLWIQWRLENSCKMQLVSMADFILLSSNDK